jgi:tRNA A22 N-methylase
MGVCVMLLRQPLYRILLSSCLSLKGRNVAALTLKEVCIHPCLTARALKGIAARSHSNHFASPDDTFIPQAETAFSILAKRNRTWKRLRHLVDLAKALRTSSKTNENQINAIVDVGTDHGILPIALAATGRFQKVIGIDISEQVLEKGARATYRAVREHLNRETEMILPLVDFLCCNGLAGLHPGDADIVCIAGMGANTMMNILLKSNTDRVQCRALLLQPTNSKPKNLIHLYDTLQRQGWILFDERIEKLQSRWYISAAFVIGKGTCHGTVSEEDLALPGTKLGTVTDKASQTTFQDYVRHHASWMAADQQFGELDASEERWLNRFRHNH